jgi:RNA polymerase sigma factor (TIGR02999 family)
MRSSGAWPRASFGKSGLTTPCSRRPSCTRCSSGSSIKRQVDWQNRAHFFGVAANVMRRILVDHARRHGASKRGEGVRCVSIDEARDVAASNEMPILALDHALERLKTVDAELANIVELRAFAGLTIEEAAHVLSVSPSTAKRDWRTAKAWLNRELGSDVRP